MVHGWCVGWWWSEKRTKTASGLAKAGVLAGTKADAEATSAAHTSSRLVSDRDGAMGPTPWNRRGGGGGTIVVTTEFRSFNYGRI